VVKRAIIIQRMIVPKQPMGWVTENTGYSEKRIKDGSLILALLDLKTITPSTSTAVNLSFLSLKSH
jgi:hypothetical protein